MCIYDNRPYLAEFFLEWEICQKNCRKYQNTQFMFENFFFSENRAYYAIIWKNIVQPDRP
jgi:hypothetical protein